MKEDIEAAMNVLSTSVPTSPLEISEELCSACKD